MKFNVITPLARFENLPKLVDALQSHNIMWHIITDDDSRYIHELKENWIFHYECPNEGVDFWVRCNNSINWFLETQEIHDDEYYCILNDDDAYEDGFFDKISNHIEINSNSSDVIICSMLRGHATPTDVHPSRRHGTDTLYGIPNNVRVCGIGVEQFLAKGKTIRNKKIPLSVHGDGEFIVELVKNNKTSYSPESFVKFNYFQPGRWNM